MFDELMDKLDEQEKRIKELETINEEHRKLNGELREENKELKMTNLALADDITKNKIIKQEALTECCGIPIGEIPMLKIQNDEYKTRIDRAIEYIKEKSEEVELNFYGFPDKITSFRGSVSVLLNILQNGEENE